MQAGKLRTRITVLRRTEGAQNASGEPAVTWASLGTFYSRRISEGGREVFLAQQTWAEAKTVYEIRYNPSITFRRTDGIVEGEAPPLNTTPPSVDILGIIDPDEDRRRRLLLACREYPT